jgi:ABC-type transport system substrate-binding protein
MFAYAPTELTSGGTRLQFTCIVGDASLERVGLALQNQLSAVGVDMKMELLPVDQYALRLGSGDFEAALGDFASGPSMVRPSLFWRTGALYNYGRYSDPAVDAAFDAMDYAASDDAYRSGFAAYQRALIDNPPAIFVAWSERARAVSTRFDVPVEAGRDILRNLRLWRPLAVSGTRPLN